MRKTLVLSATIIVLSTLAFAMTGCSDNPFIKALRNATEKAADISESFNGIEIISDTADITFVPSNTGECRIEYVTHKRITYSTSVENGVLKIKCEDDRRWFEKAFTFGKSSLTVYLPEGEYTSLVINEDTGDINVPSNFKFGSIDIRLSTGKTKIYASVNDSIKIKASTGDITVENITCTSLDTKVSTGDVYLTNVNSNGNINVSTSTGHVHLTNVNSADDITVAVSTGKTFLNNVGCTNFLTVGSTGDLNMTNLIARETINIERSTGDVHFDRCDGAEIYVTTDTGSVKGTLLTDKIFQVSTDTGKINVPECWDGGKCKISTDTGDVKISIGQ